MASPQTTQNTSAAPLALTLIVGACVCAGVIARFVGLGRWPLAIDEYYFAQSVQNILHSGLPHYACGGYYTRGLLLQYGAAALQLAGLSPELAPRAIAAVSSLIALPALYLIGRRIGGKSVALLAVGILALSVWEVEMARFGRMYAPFQALFLWYLVFFLAYTLDRQRRALLPMLILSVLGVFVWEGGVFLALINLLPPFIRTPSGRLQRRDWLYLLGTALLIVPVYWVATADFRTLGPSPALPLNYQEIDVPSPSPLDAGVMPVSTVRGHPLWLLGALLPLLFSLYAAYRVVRMRLPPSATLGLLAALACALLQQFELAADIVLLLLLFSMLKWRELVSRDSGAFFAAILASALFWIVYGLSTHDWVAEPLSPIRTIVLLGYEFLRFPDFMREVGIPWARTDPVLGCAIVALIAFACVRTIARPEQTTPAERVLRVLFICLLLGASASHPPRHETRYVFFLYPLAILLCLTMIAVGVRALAGVSRYTILAIALLCLGGFALTEDFQPEHLWNIDTAAVNFRVGLSEWQVRHYHPRSDLRGAAEWLRGHVAAGHDLVVSSFPGLDFYYSQEDSFFMEPADPRYEEWACDEGTHERWGNRPLVSSLAGLSALVSADRTVWLVIEPQRAALLAARLATAAPTVHLKTAWTAVGHDVAIVAMRRP
jgi:hypothetical protein